MARRSGGGSRTSDKIVSLWMPRRSIPPGTCRTPLPACRRAGRLTSSFTSTRAAGLPIVTVARAAALSSPPRPEAPARSCWEMAQVARSYEDTSLSLAGHYSYVKSNRYTGKFRQEFEPTPWHLLPTSGGGRKAPGSQRQAQRTAVAAGSCAAGPMLVEVALGDWSLASSWVEVALDMGLAAGRRRGSPSRRNLSTSSVRLRQGGGLILLRACAPRAAAD